jgi:transcriptional regulator with PAS, ATPase and Fis domain
VNHTADELIGSSPVIQALRAEIECAARSDAKVLLTGESGAGKDIVARMIHKHSRRGNTPLVAINCVSVPDSLLEAEFFGHTRGSFTGAYRDRMGLLEMAHRGTVFLDEACEMSTRMQALLLRFLESGEIQRVGSDRIDSRVDVRVIAATNRDPLELIENKTFRADLYYRLNVIEIKVPPLRQHKTDIPELIETFLARYSERHNVPQPAIARDAMERLVDYDWPGNVRQLKNVAERLIVRSRGNTITADDLPREMSRQGRPSTMAAAAATPEAAPTRSAAEELFERMLRTRESFWTAVYPAFMTRDLTRDDLRYIVGRGLQETSGNYKLMVELLNMKPTDYKRFLNFLRKHECRVPFERFRVARLRSRDLNEDAAVAAADRSSILREVVRVPADTPDRLAQQ